MGGTDKEAREREEGKRARGGEDDLR